ncbi:hypothetical protein BGZ96_002088 [Linnemannia gamsii]|uniref:Uncharacterized protein n=1 Tax=Linnemannia gamsii TaxID=64522 RepID=A0ABQ7K971_9FUNG|nr:hypothetical protein BGZ96_002088 [Linnemannia gamsii]
MALPFRIRAVLQHSGLSIAWLRINNVSISVSREVHKATKITSWLLRPHQIGPVQLFRSDVTFKAPPSLEAMWQHLSLHVQAIDVFI